jgi:methylenetetrahydrofolate reductase (NADPH)
MFVRESCVYVIIFWKYTGVVVSTFAGFKRMTSFCKSRVPPAVMAELLLIQENAEEVKAFGVRKGVELCQSLLQFGVDGLHFYTLNSEKTVFAILQALGMFVLNE